MSFKDLYELEKVEDIATRNKILKEASSSRDIVWKVQSAVSEAARKRREADIIKLLDEAGIEKAAKYDQEIYSGKWDIVKKYSLDNDAPKSIGSLKKKKTSCIIAGILAAFMSLKWPQKRKRQRKRGFVRKLMQKRSRSKQS